MKAALGLAVATGVLFASTAGLAESKKKNVIEEKAKKQDTKAEVKTTSAKNDPKKVVAAPAAKLPKPTKRSGKNSCDVAIDNRTGWKIQIFIDGDFEGMVSPWGDGVRPDVLNGTTKLYARADFSDGSVKEWGPRFFDCTAYSTYSWKLYDE